MSIVCNVDALDELLNMRVLYGSYKLCVEDSTDLNLIKGKTMLVRFIEAERRRVVDWAESFRAEHLEEGIVIALEEITDKKEFEHEEAIIKSPVTMSLPVLTMLAKHVGKIDHDVAVLWADNALGGKSPATISLNDFCELLLEMERIDERHE